jgi:hypothetical protein
MSLEDTDESRARLFITVHVGSWILFLAGLAAFALFFDQVNTLAKFAGAVVLGVLIPSFRDLRMLFRPHAEIAHYAREKQRRMVERFSKGPPKR